jgi:hypothetical protein
VLVSGAPLSRASSTRAPRGVQAATSPAAGSSPSPATDSLDVTADGAPDTEALSDAIAQRAALMVVKQNEINEESQLRIDHLRSEFDDAQAERAELLREMNVLRDMALEQQKHDDEILKKWIALI